VGTARHLKADNLSSPYRTYTFFQNNSDFFFRHSLSTCIGVRWSIGRIQRFMGVSKTIFIHQIGVEIMLLIWNLANLENDWLVDGVG